VIAMGGGCANGLQEHSALRALAWPHLPDLRMHGAGVFDSTRAIVMLMLRMARGA
jgi:hypothetical protein